MNSRPLNAGHNLIGIMFEYTCIVWGYDFMDGTIILRAHEVTKRHLFPLTVFTKEITRFFSNFKEMYNNMLCKTIKDTKDPYCFKTSTFLVIYPAVIFFLNVCCLSSQWYVMSLLWLYVITHLSPKQF